MKHEFYKQYVVFPNGRESSVFFIDTMEEIPGIKGFILVYKPVIGNLDFILDKVEEETGELKGKIGYSTMAKLLSQNNGPELDLFTQYFE